MPAKKKLKEEIIQAIKDVCGTGCEGECLDELYGLCPELFEENEENLDKTSDKNSGDKQVTG